MSVQDELLYRQGVWLQLPVALQGPGGHASEGSGGGGQTPAA